MILPSKFLPADRSLIVIGGEALAQLVGAPRTVSELWERTRAARPVGSSHITFDWFALALSLLYAIGAVKLENGLIHLAKTGVEP